MTDLVPDRRHSDEWIKNVQIFLKPVIEKVHKEFFHKENSREALKKGRKKYSKSKKGKIARKRVSCLWRHRTADSKMPPEEKGMIRQFYEDCPDEMQVDHIIPLCKGGRHSMKNLQWLSVETNNWKGRKIYNHGTCHPACLVSRNYK